MWRIPSPHTPSNKCTYPFAPQCPLEKARKAAQQILLDGATGPTAHRSNGLYLLGTNEQGGHETYGKAGDTDVPIRRVDGRWIVHRVTTGLEMGHLIWPADVPPPRGSNSWKLRVDKGKVALGAVWEEQHVHIETLDADQARRRARSAGQRLIIRQVGPSGAHTVERIVGTYDRAEPDLYAKTGDTGIWIHGRVDSGWVVGNDKSRSTRWKTAGRSPEIALADCYSLPPPSGFSRWLVHRDKNKPASPLILTRSLAGSGEQEAHTGTLKKCTLVTIEVLTKEQVLGEERRQADPDGDGASNGDTPGRILSGAALPTSYPIEREDPDEGRATDPVATTRGLADTGDSLRQNVITTETAILGFLRHVGVDAGDFNGRVCNAGSLWVVGGGWGT